MGYREAQKLDAKVNPSTYSKADGKKPLSQKVRWYSTNSKVAKVDKNGLITAKAKSGKCSIYARAHNGRKSSKITVTVKNRAKPEKGFLNLDAAWKDPELYGIVLTMFENNFKTVTDIAEYFYLNRPKGKEEFLCWMEDGEVKMSPENYVSGEIKQTIHDFIKNFPYDIDLHVTPKFVCFNEVYKGVIVEDYAGTIVTFQFDQKDLIPWEYTEEYELAPNWTYGYFAGA